MQINISTKLCVNCLKRTFRLLNNFFAKAVFPSITEKCTQITRRLLNIDKNTSNTNLTKHFQRNAKNALVRMHISLHPCQEWSSHKFLSQTRTVPYKSVGETCFADVACCLTIWPTSQRYFVAIFLAIRRRVILGMTSAFICGSCHRVSHFYFCFANKFPRVINSAGLVIEKGFGKIRKNATRIIQTLSLLRIN